MYIPKSLLLGLAMVGAAVGGWLGHAYADHIAQLVSPAWGVPAFFAEEPAAGGQPVAWVVGAYPPAASTPVEFAHLHRSDHRLGVATGAVEDLPAGAVSATALGPRAEHRLQSAVPSGSETYLDAREVSMSATGDHIVIAHDGAIVFIGDEGRLNASVGDVSSSGVVAVDAEQSSLASGNAVTRATERPATVHAYGASTMSYLTAAWPGQR